MLVTGTPLQNNLLELMSLLVFVMPKMFHGKEEQLKALFNKAPVSIIQIPTPFFMICSLLNICVLPQLHSK